MQWETLIGPAVVAAVVSGVIALIAMAVSRATTIRLHVEKLDADRHLAERKFEYDKRLAERKFDLDRSQSVQKRRFELAESLLSDAYRFRDLMRFVRNGATFGREGETREAQVHETDNVKKRRDTYFVPIERLQKESKFLGDLMAKEYTARAHFGTDAETAFRLIGGAVHDVQLAASMLIESVGQHSDNEFNEKLRRDIWAPLASLKGQDEIGAKITEAISSVEKFCKPALEWRGD